MTYPTPMDRAEAEDREAGALDFVCTECGKTFRMHGWEYGGQWDHPPGEPICPDCDEKMT